MVGRVSLLVVALLAACGPAGHDPDSAQGAYSESAVNVPFTERDSSGVGLIYTRGDFAQSPSDWRIDTVPNLQIGQVDGAEPYIFDRVAGIAIFQDGRIAVLNGQLQINVFDQEGQYLYRIAGRGSGPGELESAALVPAFARDSLFVFDARLARLTTFLSDGQTVEIIRPSSRIDRPLGLVGNRVLSAVRSVLVFDRPGPQYLTIEYRLVNLGDSSVVSLGRWSGASMFTIVGSGPPSMYSIPFTVSSSATVHPNGVYLAPGALPEVLDFDLDGRLRRVLRIEEHPQDLSASDIREFVAAATRGLSPASVESRSQAYELMPVPGTRPAIQSLLVDSEGWLWAETYSCGRGRSQTWILFDPDGRAKGTLTAPAGFEVHTIGPDFVIGVWRDELDIEYIHRYALNRER